MINKKLEKQVQRLIRYLANTLLVISMIMFLSSLFLNGMGTYSDLLLWTQINSMWLVVIMLLIVENYYLKTPSEIKKSRK